MLDRLLPVSVPIALGLLVLTYPVLAKVRYGETGPCSLSLLGGPLIEVPVLVALVPVAR